MVKATAKREDGGLNFLGEVRWGKVGEVDEKRLGKAGKVGEESFPFQQFSPKRCVSQSSQESMIAAPTQSRQQCLTCQDK